MPFIMRKASEFSVGQRVATGAHTDHFMRGDRYGTVEKVGKYVVYVRLDKSGRLYRANPLNIDPAE